MTVQIENDKNVDNLVKLIMRSKSVAAHKVHRLHNEHLDHSDKEGIQKNFHHILLLLTLFVFALGLLVHALAIPSLHCNCCGHFEAVEKISNTASMGSCLVCLLLVGIFVPCHKQINIVTSTSHIYNLSRLTALEHHQEIDHPPTLI